MLILVEYFICLFFVCEVRKPTSNTRERSSAAADAYEGRGMGKRIVPMESGAGSQAANDSLIGTGVIAACAFSPARACGVCGGDSVEKTGTRRS